MHILNKYFHHFIFNLYTTKKKKKILKETENKQSKKKKIGWKVTPGPGSYPVSLFALPVRNNCFNPSEKGTVPGQHVQSGAGWGCSLKGINVSLVFFFLNKKLGFCQHRFLQKTSNFPENKKNWQCFSSESTPGRESWKWKRQPQSECYNKTSLKWLHSNL